MTEHAALRAELERIASLCPDSDAGRAMTQASAALDAPDDPDAHHSKAELYEYRLLYNALAANAWAEHDIHPVVKSWTHADGELCFGGGWFIVVATLPTGQIANHYRSEHWGLFRVPEAAPPAYDGHDSVLAARRMRELLEDSAAFMDTAADQQT